MTKPYTSALPFRIFEGEIMPVSEGAEITLDIDASYRHHFAGVEFYSDENGENAVVPSAGDVAYTVRTPLQPAFYQPFFNSTLSATTPDQANWATNTNTVKATLNGIAGATHCRLRVCSNIS